MARQPPGGGGLLSFSRERSASASGGWRAVPPLGTTTVRVYWHEDGLGLPLTTQLGTRGVQLDTGANASEISLAGSALLTPAQIATAVQHKGRSGGAGGYVETTTRVLQRFDFALGAVSLTAASVAINDSSEGAGTLGSDILPQLDRLAIDFDAMTLEVRKRN